MSHTQAAAAAIACAKDALLAIWPNGKHCEHTRAREAFEALDLAAQLNEARERELVEALTGMAYQYLRVGSGKLHHDCMSAGEACFDALGWEETGHPMDPSCLCEEPGCGEAWTCGMNGRDGKYHCLCGLHFKAWWDAGNNESPEQADARWTEDMRKIGMTDDEIAQHKAKLKVDWETWKAGPPAIGLADGRMPAPPGDMAEDGCMDSAPVPPPGIVGVQP